MIETDRIYLMDCMEGMKQIADSSVDAIIADLPYGVLNRSNPSVNWDRQIPFAALWEQYRRITKPDSPIILFGQGLFSAWLMLSQPRLWRYNLVWQKDRVTGHLNAKRMPLRQHEDILVFYKKQPVYHPQMTPCPPERRNHGRPVALMEYLIRTYTDEGDVVLDNCIGSGTTAVAAIRTGRHYIGFEIEQVYCEIAERRIQEELECRNKAQEEKEIREEKQNQ